MDVNEKIDGVEEVARAGGKTGCRKAGGRASGFSCRAHYRTQSVLYFKKVDKSNIN